VLLLTGAAALLAWQIAIAPAREERLVPAY
jgi:hypothetical protein